jgi:Secretion system C-terminal sorting domain
MIYNGSAFNPTDPTQYTPANGGPVGSAVPSSTTFYTTCGGPNCESARVPVVFSVGQTMALSITPSVTSLCSGSPLTLTGTIVGGGMPYATTVWEDVTTAPVVGLGIGVMSVTFNPTSTIPNAVKTYRFTVTDACGITTSTLINITVNGFVVNLNPNTAQILCAPATTSLSITGNTTAPSPAYQWLLGTGNITGANTNTYSATASGNYALKVTDSGSSCSVTSATVPVTFEPTPADPTVSNYNICLNATVPAGQGLQSSCGLLTASQVITYNIGTQPVETNAAPGNIVASSMLSLPAGATITDLSFSIPNIQALGGSWQSDVRIGLGGAIVNAAVAAVPAVANTAGTFTYVRTVTGPITFTNNTNLDLLYWDFVNDNAGAEAIFPSTAVVTVNYTLPANTQWYATPTSTPAIATGSVLDPTTLPAPYTVNTAVSGTTTFYATCKGPNCESNRIPVNFNVAGPLTASISTPSTTVCSGTLTTLTAVVAGGGTPYSYAWKKNNVSFGGNAVSISDAPTSTSPGTVVNYSVTVTETCTGATQTANINVTVNGFTASISPTTIAPVCGAVVPQTLTANTSASTPSYQWRINGNNIVGAMSNTYSASTAGAYSVIVTDASVNCSTTVAPAVNIVFEPIAVAPVVANIAACLSGTTTGFTATTTPLIDSTIICFNITAQPVESNLFASPTVLATALLNIPAGVTVTNEQISIPNVTANTGTPTNSNMSNIAIGLTGAITQTPAAGLGATFAPGTFNYIRNLTNPTVVNGPINLTYYDVTNNVNPGNDATFPIGTCVATLKVKYTIPTTVNWYNALAATTPIWTGTTFDPTNGLQNPTPVSTATSGVYTYYVGVKGVNGCETTRIPVTFSVGQPLSVSVSSTATTICAGTSINLTATPLGGGGTYTYTWKENGTPIPGSPNAALYANLIPTATTNYSITIVDNCTPTNTANSANVAVTVNTVTASITPSAPQQVCNPPTSSIALALVTSNAVTPSYQWTKNGTNIAGALGTTYNATTSGNYAIKVTDASLTPVCTASSPATSISIFTTPSDPSPSNYAICQGGIVAAGGGLLGSCTATAESMSLSLPLLTQPNDVIAAPGTLLGTINIPAFPAGATITGATLAVNGIVTPATGSWQSEVRLGFTGAIIDANTQGTGTLNVTSPFSYTRTIPATAISLTGGAANLYYTDPFNDIIGGPDANFVLGNDVFVLTINYTLPATTYWYDSPTATTPVYIGTPFDPVSAGYVINTVPGSTTYYSECHGTYCTSLNRAACVFTVNTIPTVSPTANTPTRAGCNSQMILTTSSTPAGTNQYVWYDNAAHAGAPKGTGTTIIANTGVPGTYTYYVFEVTTGGTPCYGPSSSVTFTTIGAIPTNLPITPNTNPVANTACIDNLGWTHFFFDDVTPTNADLMLLSAYESGHYLGALGTDINISNEVYAGYGSGAGVHICSGPSAGCTGTTYPSSSNWYVMNRNWTLDIVTPSYQLTPGTTMPIRTYYTNTDFTDVQGSLTAAGYSLTQTGMYFYKVPGNPNNTQTGITIYDPVIYTNQTSGLPSVNSNYLAALAGSNQPPAGSSYTNWGWVNYPFGTNSNNSVNQFYAEYQVPSFSSGGGGASPVSPLAVDGLVLSGKSENGVNVLDWVTLQETNNAHFEVLRSVDNIAFEAIADVPTKALNGNSNATLTYQYTDISPIAKTLYYRLKQVDLNGTTSLSNIVEINLSEEIFATVQVYPNPATNVLNVEWNIPSKKALYIEVVDVVGKTLKKEQYKAKGGAEVYSLDISTLSSGIYTLRVRSVDGTFSSSSQFVKVQN